MGKIKIFHVGKWITISLVLVFLAATVFVSASVAAATEKIIKIGNIVFLEMAHSLNQVHTTQTLIDMVNEEGGIKIGNEKYKIELIVYDGEGKPDVTVAAAKRLVYQDKVKFLISDPLFIDSVQPITEQNKVLYDLGMTILPEVVLAKKNRYSFNGCTLLSLQSSLFGWLKKNHPELKTMVFIFPDDFVGHAEENAVRNMCTTIGYDDKAISSIFFPPAMVDFSSIGTQVKMENPDIFFVSSWNWRAVRAARDAGYTGQLVCLDMASVDQMASVIPMEYMEGLIGQADAVEFDPPLSKFASDAKAKYIAKFGKWDYPTFCYTSHFCALKTALEKAGSVDVDKVAEVMSKGMKFDTPSGACQQVIRPDLGNDRTVDIISELIIKQVKNGKTELGYKISLEEAHEYFNQAIGVK